MIRTGLLAMMLIAAPALAAEPPQGVLPDAQLGHQTAPTIIGSGAVTPQSFGQRIEDSAARIRARVPDARADRYGEFDVAYPHDTAEFTALNGNGMLLVAALSQDAGELPLARVYLLHPDGRSQALTRLGTARRASGSLSAPVFGPNRQDAFYLLPVSDLKDGPQLLCDFTSHRAGFMLARGLHPPARLADAVAPSSAPPPRVAVQALLDREYPGFGIAPDQGVAP